MAQFRKGSLKERLYNSILKSAMGTLIKADTFHNFVMPGSTADNLIVTAAGGPIVESIKSGVSDVAGSIINTIVGDPGSLDMKDELILYNNDGEGTYRVSLKTIAGLIAAEAVQNASGEGGILTATSLWSLLMADSDYQIDISHMRDALKNYLTKEDVQGLFRSGGHNDYISKIFDDEALGLITFLSGLRSNGVAYLMKGLQIGKFQAGITGFGAKVDGYGNGEFESLIVRRFLEVPELRFNRVEILAGDSWRAPGGGIIESVTVNSDGLTGKATLKLEEGEIGNIAVNDICMGIFHDYDNTNVNATETTDDGFGNRTFAGFCTAYFRVTSIDAVTEVDGIKYYNKTFNYAIRPTSSRWNRQMHPCQFMTFVAYGNFTNTQRQNATYETPAYTRMLRGQNSWEIQFSNIGMQFGDCGILSNFDTPGNPNPRAREASTFLFYIDGDIMHTGVLRRVDPHGRDIVDYYDQGEWDPLTEYFYKDRVSHNGSLWLCVHEDTIDEHGVIHGLIGDEPAPGNPNWLALVYADSIVSMGHWRAEECPYRAQTIVNLGGILYLSKVETSNPPRGLLTGRQNDGNTYYLKDNQGMYLMTNDNTISDDWDLLIDISESVMGEDAIYINLTNDSDSIESDENGVIPAGAEYPTTKAQLYKGSTQITSGITWAVSAVGCSATIAPESGVVATSAMTADKATVTIYATYNNVTYTKIFTFGKLFGANKLILSPSADVIKYDPNTQTFEPEILVMRAYMVKNGERTEITSTNNLGYIYLNGNTAQKYYSGMSVNTDSLSVFANGRLKFELFDSQDNIGDMEEVPLVQDGIDGAGNVVINLTNDSDSIVTDSDGNIDPNETYPTTTAELYVDMEKIPDTDVTWNCAGSGCQAVIDEHGVVTTSNMTADVATVTIIGTYVANGRSYYKVFKFRKLFGAEKYYLQCSHNVIIRDQNGSYTPNSITVRAYCKKFGEDPIECTQAANIGKIVYAGQVEPQFSPVVHVITGSSFTDRHLVFTLIDNNNNIQDTEDIPLVWDGKDGRDGEDGKSFVNKGHWDSEEEYEEGDVVQLGNQYFTCVIPNHGKPPRAILCDSVSGKYLTNEDGGYFPVGEEFDDTYWETFFRDGRDGIDGQDGRDGRDGQDGDTPVFINLTNDSDSVVTDSDGNPLESLPTTVAQFFYGSRQLLSSDGVVWGTDHVVGCQVNFNQDGEYEVTAMSADRAQVVIKATYNGVFYLRTFSFVKLYGQDKYVVEPEVGTVQYNPENGTFTPTRLALYAYVIKNGQFQSVTQESGLGYIKVGDSATRRYNGDEIVTADFFSVSGVEVSLIDNDGNVKDKEYIPRVSDGRNGQPGSDAIMIQFDDSNVHFLCDAEGVPVAGQAYTVNSSLYIGSNLSPLKSMEETGGCSVVSNMVGDRPAISFTAQITGTHNDNLQIAINGFDTNAPDNNKLTVTLVSENGQHTRIGVISVDKVRPGKDGESPIVYNVVPGVNTIKKNGSAYAPTVLTAAVRKSHVDNGAIYNDMLDPLDAFTYEGIKIYYALDKVMTSPAMADGEIPDAGITLAANSVQQYIHLAIAKANGQFLDTQSVAILQDGTSPIMADLDNEMDSVACDVDMHPDRAQTISTNVELFNGSHKHLIDRIKIKRGADVVYDSDSGSTIVPITGVTFTVTIGQNNGAAIQIAFGTTATLDEHTNYEIELYGTVNGQEVVRTITLTINGVRPGIDGSPATTFQLVPSASSISKYKDGSYSESQLTCTYTKNVGGEYVTPAGGTITMKIDSSNSEVAYRTLTPGTDFNDKVLYILKVDNKVVDKETVVIVSDGRDGIDGEDGKDGTSIVNMGHWHSGVDYPVGAWVEFMGAIYRCIQACGNIPPKVCMTDGEHFLVNRGYYIIACPEVDNSAYWVKDVPAYPDVARIDLDNENDSILYDGEGNKISASPVSHVLLYVNGEERLDNITISANWVNCSGTVSGRTITVNDVTADSGYVDISTAYNGATYRTRMNVVRIIGTDKYDIVLSHKSVHVDTNITPNTYSPSTVQVNVVVTKQNQEPRLVTIAEAAAVNLDLTYRHGSNPPVAIAVGDSIPKAVFEQSSSVIVTLEKDDVIIDQETIPVVKDGVNGTSPIVADLDNEMDSIACDVNMHPSPDDQSVVTHVVMLHGSNKQPIKSCKLYKNNTEVVSGNGITVNITGVNTTQATVTMVFSEEATLDEVNNYEIRIVSTINSTDETRSLNFVVNGIRPGADGAPAAVYNLQPSKSQIVKRKNGSYSVASLNCTYSKVVGGNAVEPATGGTIKAILDNGSTEVANRAFVPGTDFHTEVLYLLYVGGKVVDKESVPVVEDGEDGEDGKGFVDCGDWDSETEYNPGDIVHFAGEMLICQHTTKNAPYGLLKGRDGGNTAKFLKDANGGYIIVDDSELTDDWGMFMTSPDPTCRIDLDNENDSILYDNVGRNISGSCVSNISFYIGYQKFNEKVTFHITPNGCTATLSGNRIEVSDVSGDSGTVVVTCVYKGETYQAIMNITKLVGVNKYEIRPSASSLQYNPDTERYSDTGVKIDIIRTSQKDMRIVLNADAFTSGPEAGYVLRWRKVSGSTYTNINPRTTIANTDFGKEDIYVELRDNKNVVLDAETIPFVTSGGSSFRIDLSNENDSILYDNVGRNISGSVSSAVNLYLGSQRYNDQVNFTYAATGCTASLSGNVITVSNVNDGVDVGQVVVSAVFQGNTYTAVMSVKRLVGVNKYDLQFGHSEMSYDTDNKTYANTSIQVDVIRTSAKDGRTRLASDAFGTGKPEAGYVLRYFTANDLTTPAGTINPRGTIPSSAWANGDVLVQLLDNNNFVLDSETIPLVKSGSSVLRLDLSNEHDSILYDNNGKKVSGNVSTKATLFKGAAPYSGTITYTAAATGCTLASGSASSTTGDITVTGISSGYTSGKVIVSCVVDNVTYKATFTITKLIGVNKYDLVLSATEMKRDPNNSNAYDPSGGITVNVYKTNQEGTRSKLASTAFATGQDEAGYSLTYTTAGGSATAINPGSTIPASAFSTGDVLVTLKNKDSEILDTESIPLLIQGLNGNGAQYIIIKGGCHAEDGYNPQNTDGSITVYDGKNTTTLNQGDITPDASTGQRRGLALVLINKTTLAMSHKKFYDTYDPTYGNARCNAIRNAINSADSGNFIAIFSYDAIGFNSDLISMLKVCGSVGLNWFGPGRRPFAFLGYKGLPLGHALQNLGEVQSHFTADVMTYIANGNFGANPDAVRYFIEANPAALIKTSGNTWVSSGNITVKVYKQKGGQDPIPAVQGDIFARYETSGGTDAQITIQSGTGTGTISVNNLSASIRYLNVYIAHENSSTADRLDSITIPVIANGAPGYDGCQVRVTKWEDKAQNPNRLTFHNDRGTNGAFKIVDVIGVPWKQGIKDMVTGNTISEKPSSGYLWYLCEVGHNQADTYEQERTSHGGSSGKWSAMSDLGPTFVTLLVAQYAKIEFGTTNEFLFVNSRDEVVGGFSGTIDNENEDNSIRIWAGRALPTESWSYTMPSHVTGKYLWGRLEVYKGNSTTITETIKVMPTVLCSAASSYYTVNTAYNFQQSTIDTPPTSWTNWDKNSECTPSSRPSGFHLWVRVQVYSSSSTIMATYYFRVKLNAQNIHSWRMQFVNSNVNGNEPSLAPFRVTHGGELYAKHAHIEGEVIATSGTFTNGTFVSCTIQSATITGGTWNTASITNVTINTATINNVTITNADVTGKMTGSLRNPFMTVYDSFSTYDKDNLVMMTEDGGSWGGYVTAFSLDWGANQSGRLLRLASYYWDGQEFPTSGWGCISAPTGKYFFENGRRFKNLYFSRELVELVGYGTSTTFYGWIVVKRTDLMTDKAYGMNNHCIAMGRVNGRTSTDSSVTCSMYRFDSQADPSTSASINKVAEGVYKLNIPTSWKLTTSSIQVQLTPIGMVKGHDDIYLLNAGVKNFETSGGYVSAIVFYCSDDNSPNDGDFYFAIYNMEQYLQYHAHTS